MPQLGRPSSHAAAMVNALTNAVVAVRVLPPKMPGTRPMQTSRTAPPPTAVIMPSMIAGIQPSPAASPLEAPVAAQQPRASASAAARARCIQRPLIGRLKIRPVPISAVMR